MVLAITRRQLFEFPSRIACVSLVPAILRRNRQREHRDPFVAQIVRLRPGGDAAYAALGAFFVMNSARLGGEVPADVFAVHEDVIDDTGNVDLRRLPRLCCGFLCRHSRLRLRSDPGRRQLFHMRAAADRAFEQAAAFLRGEVIARGKPSLEAVLIPADEVEHDHACISRFILSHIATDVSQEPRAHGARDRNRTGMPGLAAAGFKPAVYTNFTTLADKRMILEDRALLEAMVASAVYA